ncbi:olfactory receptor 52E8-like [Discoglossus pictus]
MANRSHISEIILLGFPGISEEFDVPISIALFFTYIIGLFANGSVIALIILKQHLHQPMYVIIANLAISDLLFDTITLPKIIAKYWFGANSMSFAGCIFQLFCVHFLGSFDSYIIMLMAVDRYVAICKPLRYYSLITNKVIIFLCLFFWFFTAVIALVIAVLDSDVPFCERNTIKSCFCSNMSVMALACSDVTFLKRLIFGIAMFVLLLPLAFIIYSYIIIIKTIHSATNVESWQKAFYTCSTHLFVIGLYFIPRVFVYTANQVNLILNADVNVLLLCLYTFVPHVANPIIYCLRTKEIRKTLAQIIKNRFRRQYNHHPTVNVIAM